MALSPVRLKPRKVSSKNSHPDHNTNERCDFEFSDIKPGNYAIAVIHDENRNGELDTHVWHLAEGYGFGGQVTMPVF
jgi:uncharacterized protein (DUF2141 family)